jgi:cell fate (sporulation/competence/biofilm development) regulator YmcA (YheA/YmcA/DUF963 family)
LKLLKIHKNNLRRWKKNNSAVSVDIKIIKNILKQERRKTMKRATLFIAALMIFTAFNVVLYAQEKAPREVIELAEKKLVKLGQDPIIIKAVKKENARGKSINQIQTMDKKWKSTPGIADYMEKLMTSECGKYLRSLQESVPYYAEIFVMDNQGANVAMSDKTSDYWQGDEAKFQKSFNGGTGSIFIDDVEFDESTQSYLVQVSVPVKDGRKVIGAITFGIDIDKL